MACFLDEWTAKLENVDRDHLVMISGKPVLQKKKTIHKPLDGGKDEKRLCVPGKNLKWVEKKLLHPPGQIPQIIAHETL